ncbi:MAG: hypothetical protein JWN70_1441, partial [Planctomycetaceae bacterium]|nr:hypothetical protein [Planctomycetaceae bacterium]
RGKPGGGVGEFCFEWDDAWRILI